MVDKNKFPNVDLCGVKGVLIDIDDTLYAYEPAHQKALQMCYREFNQSEYKTLLASYEDFSKAYRAKRTEVTQRLKPQGVCRSRLFAFQSLFEDLNIHTSYNKALVFEQLYWRTLIDAMEVYQEAYGFLKECKEKNIGVCAVTDMQAHFQIEKIKALGVEQFINFLVTSEEVGVEKPDKTMFMAALRKLKLKVDEVIMIGDSLEKDIKGAQKIGIRAFRVA